MKQFIFTFKTDDTSSLREIQINSNGMMDAMRKAQLMKKKIENETGSSVTVKFLGVSYSNIA